MKNIIKYIIPAALGIMILGACEDHRSDYLDEFSTVAYFRNGGEQDLSLFLTGEDYVYAIPVCKAGSDLKGTISVEVIPFDDAQMVAYNYVNETDYTLIPSDLFAFKSSRNGNYLGDQSRVVLDFGPDDLTKLVYLEMDVQGVKNLLTSDPSKQYRIGLQVFSNGKISSGINTIVLNPSVSSPTVKVTKSGLDKITPFKSTDNEVTSYSNTLTLGVLENLWNIECEIQVLDNTWLTRYNNSKGTSYELIPEAAYEFPQKKVSFKKGDLVSSAFEVSVNRTKMDMATEYALPFSIKSCSKAEFEIVDEAWVLILRVDPERVIITEDMVTVLDSESSYAGDDGGLAAALDDDETTYWHSPWYGRKLSNPDPVFGCWFDIALNQPLRMVVFEYCTRHNNGNAVPTHIVVGYSDDGTDWTVAGDYATDEMLSAGARTWVTLPVTKMETSHGYLRFGIAGSKENGADLRVANTGSTALAELRLYGI